MFIIKVFFDSILIDYFQKIYGISINFQFNGIITAFFSKLREIFSTTTEISTEDRIKRVQEKLQIFLENNLLLSINNIMFYKIKK